VEEAQRRLGEGSPRRSRWEPIDFYLRFQRQLAAEEEERRSEVLAQCCDKTNTRAIT